MSFDDYMDHNGLLVNKLNGEDAGDSCQMQSLFRFGQALANSKDKDAWGRTWGKFNQDCDMLGYVENVLNKEKTIIARIPHPGIYVRNPSIGWWSNPNTFSKDQQRSLVMAMGMLKQPKRLAKLFWKHMCRFGFYQNTEEKNGRKKLPDFIGPGEFGEYIRAFFRSGTYPIIILWPVLMLIDLWSLVGLVVDFYQWRDPEQCDDDNLIMSMLLAKKSLPTPISWLTRKLYRWFRPVAGNMDSPGYLSAMEYKHRYSTGSPLFYELYKSILEKEM